MTEDPRISALRSTFEGLLSAAGDDPKLAERALRRLRADPKLTNLVHLPPGLKRTGRRDPAKLDPFKVAAEQGATGLELSLQELDLQQLRDIVAQFGMDPRRLVMRWKDSDRVREHIVTTTAQRARKGDAFRKEQDVMDPLSDRQRALLAAFVEAWESDASGPRHQPFDLGFQPLEHANWPADVPLPSREEVRPLVHQGLLEVDRRAAPVWRVFPSPVARDVIDPSVRAQSDALADPERRLGVILESAIVAFNRDPGTPLRFAAGGQLELVTHPGWPLEPDAVRSHDLQQLEQLGLVASRQRGDELTFWPTVEAREAMGDVASYLEKLADEAVGDAQRSRLMMWAQRVRGGDLAVGATAGTLSGALIRGLMGQ